MSETSERDAIRLSPKDNVATVLRPVAEGEPVRLADGAPAVTARADIPLCHKVALVPIAAGARIVKYGQPIGEATVPIAPGEHVHVHNLRSARARSPA